MAAIGSNSSPAPSKDRVPQLSAELILYLLILVLTPLPLGSNRDWAWPVAAVLCLLLGIVLLVSRSSFEFQRVEKVMLAAFAALCFWMLMQLTGFGVMQPLTIDPFATKSELLKTVAYACFFTATVFVARTRSHIRLIVYVIVLMGLLQALIGSVQQLLFDLPRSRGTFASPNHYAGYLEVALSMAIGLILSQQGERKLSSNPIVEFVAGPRGRLRILIVIMVIGLIMSRSRMGNLAFLTSILITSAVAFFYTRKLSRNMIVLLGSIFLLDIAIIGNYFGLERLEERLRQSPGAVTGRVNLFNYNLDIIQDHPVAGVGGGAYETAMRDYRDQFLTARFDHAENDYLEFLVELGAIGTLPLLCLLLLGVRQQIGSLAKSDDTFVRGIAFGCVMGTVCLLIHGAGDMNLQIPSNGLLMVFMLALPFALSRVSGTSHKTHQS